MARMKVTPQQLHRRLQQLLKQSNPINLTGAMKHVGMVVARDCKDSFDAQRAPDIVGPGAIKHLGGQAWPRLAPSTAHGRIVRGTGTKTDPVTGKTRRVSTRRKRRMGLKAAERQAARFGQMKRLLDTGELRKRISYRVRRVAGGIVALIGTAVKYGKYHQRGFRHRYGGRVAAAPFIGVNHGTLLAARTRILKRITKR